MLLIVIKKIAKLFKNNNVALVLDFGFDSSFAFEI